jgi:hypothetical protein
LFIINGPTADLKFTQDEQIKTVAEVQAGLSWLGTQNMDANVSWSYDIRVLNVNSIPGTGGNWPNLPLDFSDGIDTAFWRNSNGKIYFFKGNQYVRFSNVSSGVDPGYPKPIAGNWPGLPSNFNDGIDAALMRESNGKIYFFKGTQYVRYSDVSSGVDPGYPKPIAGNWPGLPADFQSGIDAAFWRKSNSKIYFFKGNQYVQYSDVSSGVDPGYPKPIAGNWPGLPEDFQSGINTVLMRKSNGKIYFFKGSQYVRYSDVSSGVDPGYPKPIGLSFNEKEILWRDAAMTSIGYNKGDSGIHKYLEELRIRLVTQWAYAAFFTKYPIGHFAYASLGGPRLVMDYNNDGWGIDNIDSVFAHETGHIFGAPDEYASSLCDGGGKWGWFGTKNENCENSAVGGGVACIMKQNTLSICKYSQRHLGWGEFMKNIDAAFWRNSNSKVYFFSGKYYVQLTNGNVDLNYPRIIEGNWPGLPSNFNNGIDAARMRESNGKIYFFKGNQYVRYSDVSSGVDPGYPKPIAGNWPGLPADFQSGIDAAFWRISNSKIYFFKGNQYVRYSDVSSGVDPGYPKPIAGNWPGLPADFQLGIDAAFWRKSNGKIYFFKGNQYVRYSDVSSGVDPGYPKAIAGNFMPFA